MIRMTIGYRENEKYYSAYILLEHENIFNFTIIGYQKLKLTYDFFLKNDVELWWKQTK